jgi:hypothetical protein
MPAPPEMSVDGDEEDVVGLLSRVIEPAGGKKPSVDELERLAKMASQG